jgi:hypothetical protein
MERDATHGDGWGQSMAQDATQRIERQIQTRSTRVMDLHDAGLTREQIALSLSLDVRTVWKIVAHFTGGPGPGDPTPEEIADQSWRIRCGEVRVASRHATGRRVLSTGERTIPAKPPTLRRDA